MEDPMEAVMRLWFFVRTCETPGPVMVSLVEVVLGMFASL